ncbi:MAG: hypothetical protein KJ888_21005 [Gammaproteobacteria bacterium]|nr:hypothetical protein [Gammaproteobacteria bacterium]
MNGNYGPIHLPNPYSKFPQEQPLAASVVFKLLSGKFVTRDSSGNYAISISSDTQIWGWAEVDADWTTSATEAIDKIVIIDDLEAVFEMPNDSGNTALTEAIIKTLIGETCDIAESTTNIQAADYNASSTDVIKIVGGSVARNSLYVKINPIKFYTLGYGD